MKCRKGYKKDGNRCIKNKSILGNLSNKKNSSLVIIIILIIAMALLVYFGYSYLSGGAKKGEPCGFDFQKCESGLFCHVAGISKSTGKMFGSCLDQPNYLGEIESCGPTVLACCGEGLVCATQPDGESYCFTILDNAYLNYPLVKKICY